MTRPVLATILRPAPKPRNGAVAPNAADLLRDVLISRLDDGFVGGETAELLDAIEDLIKPLGLDRHDVLRAVQNDLFPESFMPPSAWRGPRCHQPRPGLVPKSGLKLPGVPGGGAAAIAGLLNDIWAQRGPKEKSENG